MAFDGKTRWDDRGYVAGEFKCPAGHSWWVHCTKAGEALPKPPINADNVSASSGAVLIPPAPNPWILRAARPAPVLAVSEP